MLESVHERATLLVSRDSTAPADGPMGEPLLSCATMYLPMYIYTVAFSYLRFGYAASLTVAMYAITGALIFLQYRLTRRWHEGFRREF